MPVKRWIISANHAIEGILHAAATQRHLRYHFYAAVLILLVSTLLGVSRNEFIAISIVVMIVLAAELLNTALEAAIDLFSLDFHPKAKAAKDVAAGAVLVTALGALVVAYIILYPPIKRAFTHGLRISRHSPPDVAVIALVIVLILVVLIKALTGKGQPLQGGMPSGHAAVSFSIWASACYMFNQPAVSVTVGMLALAVASSRVASRIHTLSEVIIGGILGAGVTFLLFLIFA
ncbi:MAG: diacylglycerol kinase [Nitrospirae bacterium]|nr:diacylglycerol kinase [Nitrospirota bacterium]